LFCFNWFKSSFKIFYKRYKKDEAKSLQRKRRISILIRKKLSKNLQIKKTLNLLAKATKITSLVASLVWLSSLGFFRGERSVEKWEN